MSSATVDLESAEAKAVLEGKADTFTHNWQADGTPFTLATANIALFTDKKPHELCETMGWHDESMIDTTPRVRKAEQLAKKEERKAKAAPSAGAPKRKELKSRGAAMSVAPGGRGFKCPGGPATRSSTRRRRQGRPGCGQMKMRVARAMTTSELPSPSEQTRQSKQ